MKKRKLIKHAKYATAVACVMCDNRCPKDKLPRRDGCDSCGVGKLIKMLQSVQK